MVIAHRLSTVKNADNVIVIEKGRVSESGTHAELLDKGGSYSRLVARQLEGDKLSEAEVEVREQRRIAKREERERKEQQQQGGLQVGVSVGAEEEEAKMADGALPSPSLSADYASQGEEGVVEDDVTGDERKEDESTLIIGTAAHDPKDQKVV